MRECLMRTKTMAAMMQKKPIQVQDLVVAALACRCAGCNEALTRHAEIQLRRQFNKPNSFDTMNKVK